MALFFAAVVASTLAVAFCNKCDPSQLQCEDDMQRSSVQLLQHTMALSRGSAVPQWQGKNGNTIRSGSTTGLAPADIAAGPAWSWTAPLRPDGIVRASPIVDPTGAVYISAIDGDFLKFSRTGSLLWKRTFERTLPGNPSYESETDRIFTIMDDCTFVALDAQSGHTIWSNRFAHGAGTDTLTVISGSGVVMSACYGFGEKGDFGGATFLVAVNATNGVKLWSFRSEQMLYNWIGSIQDSSVLFSDALGGVYRLNLFNGSVIWYVPAPSNGKTSTGGLAGSSNGAIAYVTGNVGEGSGKWGSVSAYMVSDGSLVWHRELPYTANSGPAISLGDKPFVVVPIGPNPALALEGQGAFDIEPYNQSKDMLKPGKLVVLDALDGHTRWEYDFPDWHGPAAGDTYEHSCLPDSFANPSIAGDGSIFVNGEDGKLYRFHDADGDGKANSLGEVSTFDTGNGFQGAPAISDGILAIAPCNGLQVFLA
mmetsp:Transcript_23543/g.44434  ORF Transcript_23543/g.44434 Transcript_23543/m.44434 type:complete len:480 (+) Transcript_23543:43-1482(+)